MLWAAYAAQTSRVFCIGRILTWLVSRALGSGVYPVLPPAAHGSMPASANRSGSGPASRAADRGGLLAAILMSTSCAAVCETTSDGIWLNELAGAAIGTLFFWLSSFFYASGNVGRWTKAYGVYAALTVILAWWFIQEWGFVGLAGLTAAAKIVFTVAMAVALPTPRAQKISPSSR